jgi:hypothetical protein
MCVTPITVLAYLENGGLKGEFLSASDFALNWGNRL